MGKVTFELSRIKTLNGKTVQQAHAQMVSYSGLFYTGYFHHVVSDFVLLTCETHK